MKIIELRRHSKRVKSSPHLTQYGVDLAQKIGQSMGKYHKTYSSYALRAIETAVAMGYAIDEIYEEISITPEDIQEEVSWGMNFEEYAIAIREGQQSKNYAKRMADFLLELVHPIPDSTSILILSHGGLIEISTIGCFPNLDFSTWGNALEECEGVLLYVENNDFVKTEKIVLDKKRDM